MTVVLVKQSAGTIAAVNTGLADEHPTQGVHLEQTGERIAFAKAVLTHRIVGGIAGFVARGGAGKAAHGLRLRTKEGGGACRE